VEPAPPIFDPGSRQFTRLNTVWLAISLAFLGVLASLPPQFERHKQIILLTIGFVQLLETRIIARFPKRGVSYVVLLKILLATLLIDHTGEVAINSSYYPIYYLPVITAALYCGPWMTMLWTLFASTLYCFWLYPAVQEYTLTPEAYVSLSLRLVCFFLVAIAVNRSRNIAPRGTV
jgi:hypothetical protein